MPTSEWQELTALTGGKPFVVERVRLIGSDIRIEGTFEVPELMHLSPEDLVFVVGFLRCEGSIKEMEKMFGVSYPTIRGRLKRISSGLRSFEAPPIRSVDVILDQLAQGQLNAEDANKLIRGDTIFSEKP